MNSLAIILKPGLAPLYQCKVIAKMAVALGMRLNPQTLQLDHLVSGDSTSDAGLIDMSIGVYGADAHQLAALRAHAQSENVIYIDIEDHGEEGMVIEEPLRYCGLLLFSETAKITELVSGLPSFAPTPAYELTENL